MIAHLRGRILEKQPTRLVVEVGGLGLEVLVPLSTARGAGEVGEEVSLPAVLVVREDSLTLYGFSGPRDRALFLKLIGVSGIGPKLALNALSGSGVEELVAAIRDRDLAFLVRLPGIGKKTAERLSVELQDALAGFEAAAPAPDRVKAESVAVAALVSLGYKQVAAREAVRRALEREGKAAGVEELIRAALGSLSGGTRTP